ncbi:methyltransferase domain-containing protein [Nonomuraea sp. NPDC050404]|uniref:methyltransferase domain-containing protein n=1 Tax=Nonomuraea sp. NPDC050404 TaxID=3155783 RepID=UPI0033C1B75A
MSDRGEDAVDWKEPARRLAAEVAPPASRWRSAVEHTKRHLFVPRWWTATPEGWKLRIGEDDPEKWQRAAYRDRTLVTRVGDVHADHATPGVCLSQGSPTSSSTHPSLLVKMYRHASIDNRSTVLDVGTGTGYGTALLCYRLGHHRVTAIDVDPYLTGAAEQRLDERGWRPRLLTADATGPIDWEGDRIVATVAVRPIPASWLAALQPGGRLVTTVTGTSLIIVADKQPDGGAAGVVDHSRAGFMRTRTGPDYPAQNRTALERARAEEGEQVESSQYPVMDVVNAWDVSSMLDIIAPGIEHRYITYDDTPDRVALMAHEDGSWCRAEETGGKVTIHQGGPRRLHSYLDQVREHWLQRGELPIRGAAVTITPDGVITLKRGNWTATIVR